MIRKQAFARAKALLQYLVDLSPLLPFTESLPTWFAGKLYCRPVGRRTIRLRLGEKTQFCNGADRKGCGELKD